jgi:hypothetical protein
VLNSRVFNRFTDNPPQPLSIILWAYSKQHSTAKLWLRAGNSFLDRLNPSAMLQVEWEIFQEPWIQSSKPIDFQRWPTTLMLKFKLYQSITKSADSSNSNHEPLRSLELWPQKCTFSRLSNDASSHWLKKNEGTKVINSKIRWNKILAQKLQLNLRILKAYNDLCRESSEVLSWNSNHIFSTFSTIAVNIPCSEH